ncbi:hypothetical protein A0J48_023030 [Sphaerospermopsis aphanizomenoides BCCUSP55]|uniref:hypothetical protein n=1 Tax=Sphaerospermopsis aphanizomenoides TaxID=459663 RepID=UPI0019082F32|nr:hypothetical protein [Sphaerospermopsis aphanizomenoides]MBK1990361.1 hypothetical protein [Sphaerospermopsis aphanizomenoides BCCUSP55]
MKLSLLTLAIVMGAICGISVITTTISTANANPKPTSAIQGQHNQSANLITEAATLTNKWNTVIDTTNNTDANLSIRDPECKKINPLEYINNPETFFQPCAAENNLDIHSYEPIEYLKVPRLDSGVSVTVTNF